MWTSSPCINWHLFGHLTYGRRRKQKKSKTRMLGMKREARKVRKVRRKTLRKTIPLWIPQRLDVKSQRNLWLNKLPRKKQEPNQENKEVPPKKDAVVEPGTGSKKGGDEKGVTRVDSAVPAESVPSAPVKKPGETASGAANASASAGNLVELCVVVTRIETHSEVVYLKQMSSWCVQA